MLVNRSNGEVLTTHVEVADNVFKRGLGLMFKGSYEGALVFPKVRDASFHGFFCFFPILLLCLDKENRVAHKKVLKPWSLLRLRCETVIELDARREWKVNEGDELSWNAD